MTKYQFVLVKDMEAGAELRRRRKSLKTKYSSEWLYLLHPPMPEGEGQAEVYVNQIAVEQLIDDGCLNVGPDHRIRLTSTLC